MIVLDASVAVAWLVPSQATRLTEALLERWTDGLGYAPHIFPLEVRGALLKRERVDRTPTRLTMDRLKALTALGVLVQEPPELMFQDQDLDAALDLARRSGCTLQDAHYLELAMQLNAPLVSRDGGQIAGAIALRIEHLDLRDPRN